MLKTIRLTILSALSLALVLPASTFAAGPAQSITLSPSSTNLTVEPGVSATRNLTLINDGDGGYPIELSTAPYSVSGESYDPQFTRIPGTTDASQWIKLSQTKATLAGHSSANIPYTLTVPEATAPGGYYAVIFVESASDSTTSGGVTARNRVGDILYITVPGTVKQEGKVNNVKVPGFYFGTDVPISMTVSNNGGVHFQSATNITVKSLTGKTVYSNDNSYYVLPQTTRLITQTWTPGSIAGIYKVSRSATVPSGTQNLPDSWIIIATPRVIPLIVFIVLAIVGIILLLRRSRKHKN